MFAQRTVIVTVENIVIMQGHVPYVTTIMFAPSMATLSTGIAALAHRPRPVLRTLRTTRRSLLQTALPRIHLP